MATGHNGIGTVNTRMEDALGSEDEGRIHSRSVVHQVEYPTAAAVIVVTHDGIEMDELRSTIRALGDQTVSTFAVVVVDNGSDRDLLPLLSECEPVTDFVRLNRNFGANVGRNIGSKIRDEELLVFLDHDAVPERDFVEEHVRGHRDNDIVALRGKVRPKSPNVYNRLATLYDLGDEPFPYTLDIEGNCSVKRDPFFEVGGFLDDIWGHEGVHLSEKLVALAGRERIVYHPGPVIYHDFATDFGSFVRKKARHQHASAVIGQRYPELLDVYDHYTVPESGRDTALLERAWIYYVNKVTSRVGRLVERRYSYEDAGAETRGSY